MNAPAIPIVALDVSSGADALALVSRLGSTCRFYKVGSELFTSEDGSRVVKEIIATGADVFLDLKFHDIPNTVRKAARAAAAIGARLLTVHASGGRAMLEAAREGAGERCGVLAVTVLTSLDRDALGRAWGRDVTDMEAEVVRLAALAVEAGLHGVVCSGKELAALRRAHGERLAPLVPGIRLVGGDTQDQVRVVTPEDAVRLGARYLVLGRAVTAAPDPRQAMETVLAEMATARDRS